MTKNKKLLLDTNVILRYLLQDNEKQYKQLQAIFESIRIGKKTAVVTDGVIAECVYVLDKFYKVPKTEIVEQLESLFSYKGMSRSYKSPLVNSLDIYKSNNIDIVDAMLVEIAKSEGFELLTFDKGIKRLLK